MKNVISAKYFNSGGGCITYYGQLENGKYFVLGLNHLMILNADYGDTLTDEFYEKTGGDTYDWEKEHTLEQYSFPTSEKYPNDIVTAIFEKLKETYPNRNDWDDLCNTELLRDKE